MLYSKYAPSLVIHLSHLSNKCEYHDLLLRTIHRDIFSHLPTNQSAAQQVTHRCKQVIIGRSQVWRVNRTG